ncbi:hypothetical protein C173_19161 [Paenibacillus sp. FSL R7-277]|uniref:hypothetical protein n=1 Tax=Paenibacillus sp. FSL R7-277 TaxID=1227352 RepID=UPI0003E1E923|nr:hypothetical protein [Paenibacillus sp. FSL R7-277]ETT65180.1 hypothetical protein C173_19161 [Paenibacillus sp. FSL R7-277]
MNYSEIYDLHLQLLKAYSAHNNREYTAYQREIDYYTNQLRFAEDMVQRIFVLNQLVKLHEKEREDLIRWCSEAYFHKNYDVNDSPDGSLG